jgi:uncharacterized protein YbjT (DUF2867 family)
VEDKLKASGLEYTILRPNSFMQNILTYGSISESMGRIGGSSGNSWLNRWE